MKRSEREKEREKEREGETRSRERSTVPCSPNRFRFSTCVTGVGVKEVVRLRVGWLNGFWERHRDSRRCSRDTYPESHITEYT